LTIIVSCGPPENAVTVNAPALVTGELLKLFIAFKLVSAMLVPGGN